MSNEANIPQKNISNSEKERVLTYAVVNVADRLGLNDIQLAKILFAKEDFVTSIKNEKSVLKFGSVPYVQATLLVRIYKSLDAMTGGNQKIGQQWMKSQNSAFGDSPISHILKRQGINDVVKYLDTSTSRI